MYSNLQFANYIYCANEKYLKDIGFYTNIYINYFKLKKGNK